MNFRVLDKPSTGEISCANDVAIFKRLQNGTFVQANCLYSLWKRVQHVLTLEYFQQAWMVGQKSLRQF